MTLRMHSILGAALLVATSAATAASNGRLLPASASDLVPTRLSAASKALNANPNLDHAPVSLSWAIDADTPLDARPQVHVQESRAYWVDTEADQLQAGLALRTSAPGAVIRISPHAGNAQRIDASNLSIRSNGRLAVGAEAVQNLADEDALRAAGMDAPAGSIAFRLADNIPAGQIELIVPSANGRYLVHVFEPASKAVLNLTTDRDTTIAGENVRVHASSQAGATIERLSGLLSAPDGFSQAFEFQRQADGSFLANVRPDRRHAGGFGLWEVHAFGEMNDGRLAVAREAHTALAVSVASARLDGSLVRLPGKGEGLDVRVGVEVASPSRYQLAGVLYGTRADGSTAPVAVAHSARWLERGNASIDLEFDAAALGASGIHAPYQLRDLRLINQADMSLVERRERASGSL